MTHNEQVLNRSLDKWKMATYLEEYPAHFEPTAIVFEDAESEIIYFVNEYITEHGRLPYFDDIVDQFNLETDADYEALEKYMKREKESMNIG